MNVRLTIFTLFCLMNIATAFSQDLSPYAYEIGSPSVVDYYVDPVNGSDSANGRAVSTSWRTVRHAWEQIPDSSSLSTGYRINLMNGNYGSDELPNYWELKRGTSAAPIILRAASGQTGVRLTRDINMANVSYFYLLNLEISPSGGGDAFHCEGCDHLLIRGCILNGGSISNAAHETLKINQSQYVYVENNNIAYADDNNIDFVSVQYGHIIGNKVHDAADWCAYVKGGSAYIRVEGNEFFNCGTGGFTAGQGSGFQFMTSPWLHYEAYDIKVINNVIHDADGAALGVNGAYNILIAHNTAYRTGSRDHMLEVVFGERTCDGEQDNSANSTCQMYNSQGGWGPSFTKTSPEPISNRNVFIFNNIFYNPSSFVAPQHFAVYGPRMASSGTNLGATQYADTNLRIQGNLIWNGSGDTPLGIEDSDQGCQDSNPTCNLSQLQSENLINQSEPSLADPAGKDWRPTALGNPLNAPTALTDFAGGDRPSSPNVPAGALGNAFNHDFSGREISGAHLIGAFAAPDSSLTPPTIDDADTPDDPSAAINAPSISSLKFTATKSGRKIQFTVTVNVSSETELTVLSANLKLKTKLIGRVNLSRKSSDKYQGKLKIKVAAHKKIKLTVYAANSGGTTSKSKSVSTP